MRQETFTMGVELPSLSEQQEREHRAFLQVEEHMLQTGELAIRVHISG